MTQISKYRLRESTQSQLESFLIQTLTRLSNPSDVKEFVNELFTRTEKVMLSKRLAIGVLLARGYNFREIARELKVSTTTVTTFAAMYKYGTSYKKVVDRIESDVKSKKEILKIGEAVASIGAMAGAKSGGWFAARNELRKKKNELL